ncbi:MAG: porin family protein [Deltaproteobacteria bacterium]|nr:porin family protein [Deltaproteobacteria bacterium]
MRKLPVLFLAGILCAATSTAALAERYDRYDRPMPPPRRGAEVPPPQHAVYGQPYFFGHISLFEPNDDTDGLKGYDSGGAFDIGLGSRVSPNLAVEGTFGAYSADTGPDEVTVVPLTIGARIILPSPVIEPYIGGGVGLYFADLKESAGANKRGFASFSGIDDSDTTFGGYLQAGVDAWLNPRMALNFEGKYHWADPTFTTNAGNSVDVNVAGWQVGLGLRVSF